ncbi:MAG: YkgJ family cysteine cluster protein [Sulfurospirillaceae bacterium]
MGIEKSGFNFGFDPTMCSRCKGNCCVGESGYIWVDPPEIKKIADFLNISVEEFGKKYIFEKNRDFSLKEVFSPLGYACIFFDVKGLKCTIYPVRPNQCKTFPFWEHFKKNIEELEDECPGVYRL